jgi:pantoate--beta-alanine ligase
LGVELIEQAAAWRMTLDQKRAAGKVVGLVPTMGALHGGHLSLIRRAAAECGVVAVTDYVNPLQFAPNEDLSSYPRDLARDRDLAGEAGATILFAPTPEEMWPQPAATSVHVKGLTDVMEGRSRPGHFDGVATIVTKFFALAGECRAYFGEKDYQQLTVIRRLVTDLSLPVEVVPCSTVRDTDGLALSSRNAYLTTDERALAPQLFYALLAGKHAVEEDGVADPGVVVDAMEASLAGHTAFTLDYAEVADPVNLTRPALVDAEVRLLMAARLGRARLIDNVVATPPSASPA